MLRDFHQIKIYIPVSPERSVSLEENVSHSEVLQNIIELIKISEPIGTVGNYSGVHEIGAGIEGFTPEENSTPTLGAYGQPERTRTLVLVTYAPLAAEEAVSVFTTNVVKLHPWEHPVIEVSIVKLWCPA
jgi:hypothetical protein